MPPAPWKASVQASLKANGRHMPYAKYLQLATVRADGAGPANRTVVFRDFLGDARDELTFVTDARSGKVAEAGACPWAEVAWYFPGTREQYRIYGRLSVVGAGGHAGQEWPGSPPLGELQSARRGAWARLSDEARKQFCWPQPGAGREADDAAFTDPPGVPGAGEDPARHFCLVVLWPVQVDHLQLRGNRRHMYTRVEDGSWAKRAVNP